VRFRRRSLKEQWIYNGPGILPANQRSTPAADPNNNRDQCTCHRAGAALVAAPMAAPRCGELAPTTRAFTPVFGGLRGAPTMVAPPAPNKSPARSPARAQIASFNFTNTPILVVASRTTFRRTRVASARVGVSRLSTPVRRSHTLRRPRPVGHGWRRAVRVDRRPFGSGTATIRAAPGWEE
jgi:hypothetical protein